MELENGDSMPFLDVRVIKRVNKYETTVYHKKTFTRVYLIWVHPPLPTHQCNHNYQWYEFDGHYKLKGSII
jgi:hypothetical protein